MPLLELVQLRQHLLSLLVRTQEYNFVVRSGVFEFPVAGRITAGYRRTFISDLGSRFRFERNAPTGTPPSEGAMCQGAAQDPAGFITP